MPALKESRAWSDTRLWKALVDITDEGHPVRVLIQSRMPEIQLILRKAATSPKDFTLHDSDHAYRVAELMIELIPLDVLSHLSSHEIGFLLLAAYLHDIGMTPESNLISKHIGFLAGMDEPRLDDPDLSEFRRWLFARQGKDFGKPEPNPWKIKELVTYYTRARHNDWSAAWIRTNFGQDLSRLYSGWLEDLVRLCKSHHWGFNELATPEFDPRIISSTELIHRRYLAMILRVADILDNDPERVPDVILRHRAIAQSSLIHWQRPMYMTVIIAGAATVYVTAHPSSALMQKAILDTVQDIDAELSLCDKLARLFPLNASSVGPLPHHWKL